MTGGTLESRIARTVARFLSDNRSAEQVARRIVDIAEKHFAALERK